MPGLSTVADARIQRHVVSDSLYPAQRRRSVPDQRGALYRGADLPVKDAVCLGTRKHEFSVGDIHLAAAEADSVDSVLQVRHYRVRLRVSAQHVCVRHSRHRDMGMALPSAVSRRRDPHKPRVLPVLHETDEDSVLDEYVPARRRAFIVDRKRSASIGKGAVIQNRDAPGRHALPQQLRERGCPLAVEVPLEPVTHGLVQ